MDAELSFVMCNMACLQRNNVVMDPFLGTGSIVIAASVCGAHVIGGDIDRKTLAGWNTPGFNVFSNFVQYNLQLPLAIVTADNNRSPWRTQEWIDCIITDPPYGIRESVRYTVKEDVESGEHPQRGTTVRVGLVDTLDGLIDFAAAHLVEFGRLVYWLPCTPDFRADELPTHPRLRVLAYGAQPLSMRLHRRLIVMEKVSPNEFMEPRETITTTTTRKQSDLSFSNIGAKMMRQEERREELLVRIRP